jgi:hypothetical protein
LISFPYGREVLGPEDIEVTSSAGVFPNGIAAMQNMYLYQSFPRPRDNGVAFAGDFYRCTIERTFKSQSNTPSYR